MCLQWGFSYSRNNKKITKYVPLQLETKLLLWHTILRSLSKSVDGARNGKLKY